ncbi:unnamed protein product [Toxocara canis]|uniref:F-box domain-containing protein n=1 Tax=Toxocara canis TaxID=6265 RepID=A0A183TYW1_TOXCA|nr:unnamed protein product [Toxocara canis]
MAIDFPSTFLSLLLKQLNWADRICLSRVSNRWKDVFRSAPREGYFAKSASIGCDYITFEMGHIPGETSEYFQFDNTFKANCKHSNEQGTTLARPTRYSFSSLASFVYDIEYVQAIYVDNDNRSQLHMLYDFFRQHCAHWKCYTVVPKYKKILLTLPIGLLDKPVRVDFGERFRKSGVLTIRIFVDKQRNVDPATWLNESLAGLIKGLQYTVNVDVCISGFTVRSMEQVDRIANDFAHAYERLFISRPIPECIIELRLEGRGRLHGRFRYSYSRCPLYVYVER